MTCRPVPLCWPGATVVIIAGGLSLTDDDCAYVEGRAKVIAINDSWRRAPFADILYGSDAKWWNYYRGVPEFTGEKWLQDKLEPLGAECAARWGLNLVRSEPGQGLSLDPSYIHQGSNSAYQAMNFAVLAGAVRILFLGLDCQGGHWHGEHPVEIRGTPNYAGAIKAFETSLADLSLRGISVINCSPATALMCFPRKPILECL